MRPGDCTSTRFRRGFSSPGTMKHFPDIGHALGFGMPDWCSLPWDTGLQQTATCKDTIIEREKSLAGFPLLPLSFLPQSVSRRFSRSRALTFAQRQGIPRCVLPENTPVPRKISIEIAQSLVEFPLSPTASVGSDDASGQGRNVSQLQAARMQRARHRRPSYHPEATKPTPTTKVSAGGSVSATVNANSNSPTSALGTRSSSPAEPVCDGSRAGGDEVLRSMGGGYLTVTALCTLSRALLLYTDKQAADISQKPPHDGHRPDNDIDGQFEPAREVAELLSLLASLFRLGSPSFQVSAGHTPPPSCTSNWHRAPSSFLVFLVSFWRASSRSASSLPAPVVLSFCFWFRSDRCALLRSNSPHSPSAFCCARTLSYERFQYMRASYELVDVFLIYT